MLMPVQCDSRLAKNTSPGGENMRGRSVLCLYQPALITAAQHPGIVEDGEVV